MGDGYIKLHRKLLDWGWYSDPNTFRVFMHLLLIASYEENEYRGRKIKPGQAVIGRKKLAKDLGMSEQSVRTSLQHLVSTNEITIEPTNKFSIVTIGSWAKYQVGDNESNHQSNQQPNTQLTNNQPTTNHTQESKESKKVRKDIYKDVPEPIKEPFMRWAAMRKRKKNPLPSEQAVHMALNKLNKLSQNTQKQIELIDYAEFRGWMSFYPIPPDEKQKPKAYREFEKEPEIQATEMPNSTKEIANRLSGMFDVPT